MSVTVCLFFILKVVVQSYDPTENIIFHISAHLFLFNDYNRTLFHPYFVVSEFR